MVITAVHKEHTASLPVIFFLLFFPVQSCLKTIQGPGHNVHVVINQFTDFMPQKLIFFGKTIQHQQYQHAEITTDFSLNFEI